MTRKLTLYSILLAALYDKARERTLTAIIKAKTQTRAQEFFAFQSQYFIRISRFCIRGEVLKLERKYRLAKGGEDL